VTRRRRGAHERGFSDGISSLQGGHHVAQKFRNTTFPLKSLSRSGWPARSGTVKSAAAAARPGRSRSSSLNASARAASGSPTTSAITSHAA